MISWTPAGAVESPTTLQIRVQRSYPGRVRAGAPVPTRSMSTTDILRNIEFFTRERQSTRIPQCTCLLLSGVGVVTRPDIVRIAETARQWGIQRLLLHAGGEDLRHLPHTARKDLLDAIVVPMQPVAVAGGLSHAMEAVAHCRDVGISVTVNTVLTQRAVDRLPAVARAIARLKPDRVLFTYPFPVNGNEGAAPPPIRRTLAAMKSALVTLVSAGVRPRLKGLPACYLGNYASFIGRTSNRWYVDADHQRDGALMFFPEVLSFHKEEICRFCSLDTNCDGFFATYLRRPGFPPLDPQE